MTEDKYAICHDLMGKMCDAIDKAGADYLNGIDPRRVHMGWADVPSRILAQAAYEVMTAAGYKREEVEQTEASRGFDVYEEAGIIAPESWKKLNGLI